MNRKILLDIVGVLLIVLVVLVGYKLSPILLPKADLTVEPDASCDLQKTACQVDVPEYGRLTFSVGTQPIPLVKPFAVKIEMPGAEQVEIDFSGVDMDMGYNRPLLQKTGDGVFSGEATLPVCITGRMTWQATVLVETSKKRIALPFRFVTGESLAE
ncbi:hypothetical protein [Azonexus sp.]|uniref:hypothetical protein n=1 Tax=Azonexus sp. TaxID=1872668 RepID=UPI0039E6617D